MANRTNSSEYFWSYEYYWDYIDPIPVDGRKLKVNKYSIVIAFWVGLAAFVMFLFLILLYMSRSGSNPVKPAVSKAIWQCFVGSPRIINGKQYWMRCLQVVVRNQVEESSSNSEQLHCDNLSSPFPDLVAPGTPSCLPDDSGIHGSISA